MESSLTAVYQPLDLAAFKRPKVATERELEVEVAKNCELLKDTCNIHKYIFLRELRLEKEN